MSGGQFVCISAWCLHNLGAFCIHFYSVSVCLGGAVNALLCGIRMSGQGTLYVFLRGIRMSGVHFVNIFTWYPHV